MVEAFCSRAVRAIAAILAGYLFLQGLFTICNIQRINEKNYFVSNNAVLQAGGILLFFLVCCFMLKPLLWNWLEKHGEKLFWILLMGMAAFLVWWVYQTCFWFYGDTEKVYMCAGKLIERDFEQWMPGGYAYMWPHQNGLILFVAAMLRFLTVGQSFYAFYFVSIFFYVITIGGLFQTLKLLFQDRALVSVQGIMLFLYFPYAFLTMCMYGDSIGYGWSVLAIYYSLRYLKGGRIRYLLVSGVCIALGICFKQNCMIILAGILILMLADLLFQKRNYGKKGLLIMAYLLLVMLGSSAPDKYIECISGMEQAQGNSKIAHIAMGVQESDKAPGWYNGYNEEVFAENHYDHDETARAAAESLKESLQKFVKNPFYAWQFFHHKLASEWNNPTFECFHVQNGRETSKELSSLVKSTINDGGKVNILLIFLSDILQSVLLFGVLMYFIHGKGSSLQQLLPAILFIGAFLFWLVWEAKPRYVAPYFLLLIPYAFLGYQTCIVNRKNRSVRFSMAAIVIIAILTSVSDHELISSSLKLGEDTESYYEYIHEYNDNFIKFRY